MDKDARITQLQLKIGTPPWTNAKVSPSGLNNLTTGDLAEWAILHGMPETKAHNIPRATLEKCYYTNKKYFDVVAGNRPRGLNNPMVLLGGGTTNEDDQIGIDPQHLAPSKTPLPRFPPTISTTDPIKKLLSEVEGIVNQKLRTFTSEAISNTRTIVKQELQGVQESTLTILKALIESGQLSIQLGQGLESKILNLVQKAADETIFSSLAQRDKGKHREENQEPLEPELPFPPLPSSSSFVPEIDPNFYIDPFVGRVIRKAITLGRNLYASGDTGCGKTATIMQVFAILGRGIIRVNPHDGITKESFIGRMGIRPVESGGTETYFSYGDLAIAMKNGLGFLLDEGDYLPPNLAAVFNPVTERGGKLHISETGETISPAPGFCVFVTANTGGKGDNSGQYTGTEVLNTAWLDRFSFKIKMDYLPQDKELEMLKKRFPKLSEDSPNTIPLPFGETELNKILQLAHDIREAFSRGELSITFSTRKLIDYFEQRENGFSQREALSLCLLSWLDDDDETLVKTMLDRLQISAEEE
jgi:cobaltochelatase CobS